MKRLREWFKDHPVRHELICTTALFIGLATVGFTAMFVAHEIDKPDMLNITYSEIRNLDVPFTQPGYSLTFSATAQQYNAGTSYNANGNASVSIQRSAVSGPNQKLYQYCTQYFHAAYGNQQISPLLPMAISNVETPGRADHNVTWSALFPSKVVSIDLIDTFDVTTVISDENYYKVLSTEYSTRDRGCLQMSPTYGTNNTTLNGQMSGTEADKLKAVDTSAYSTWVKGASTSAGDRFYLPDVLLRMSAAMQLQCDYIAVNKYTPDNDFQLIAMCAMGHQSSGIWSYSNHERAVGVWKSSGKAYEWAKMCGSLEMVQILTEYASKSNSTYIDSKTAEYLFKQYSSVSPSDYATKDVVCWYPIKALYSYIKLCMLYTQ